MPQTPYMLTADRIIPEGYHLRYLSNQTAPLVIRNPGQALFLDQMTLQGGKPILIFDLQKATSRLHGNTRTSATEATLYAKFDRNGNFEKWGISKDPDSRYTLSEMAGGWLKPLRTGPRDLMLDKERRLTERFPGPKNKEPWAGIKKSKEEGL